jgi:hypothetical protein
MFHPYKNYREDSFKTLIKQSNQSIKQAIKYIRKLTSFQFGPKFLNRSVQSPKILRSVQQYESMTILHPLSKLSDEVKNSQI